MPVGVGVVPGRDGELVLAADQAGHGVRRRAVHPDLAVPVQGHEPEGGVYGRVDDGQVQAVAVADLAPVGHARPAERVGADAHSGRLDRGQVHHLPESGHVAAQEVELPGGAGRDRPGVPDPAYSRESVGEQLVRPVLDLPGDVGAGRAAVGRVVLEPAVRRRVVRGRDHDPVGAMRRRRSVVREDRAGHRGRRRVPAASVDHDPNLVGGEYLERADLRWLGKRVRVGAQVQRPVDPVGGPVFADRLGGGQDVVLVERRRERGPPVPRRAERHPLPGIAGIGMHRVVGGHQLGDVYEIFGGSGLPRTRVCHAAILTRRAGAQHACPALVARPAPG